MQNQSQGNPGYYPQMPQMPQMGYPPQGYPQYYQPQMPPMGYQMMPPKKDDTMTYVMGAVLIAIVIYAYYSQQTPVTPAAAPKAEQFAPPAWHPGNTYYSTEYEYAGLGVAEWDKIYGTGGKHNDDTTNGEMILRGSILLGPSFEVSKVTEMF